MYEHLPRSITHIELEAAAKFAEEEAEAPRVAAEEEAAAVAKLAEETGDE